MSHRFDKIQSLLGVDVNELREEDLIISSREILESGMHGICFSPYEGDQKPGDLISEEQIRRKRITETLHEMDQNLFLY